MSTLAFILVLVLIAVSSVIALRISALRGDRRIAARHVITADRHAPEDPYLPYLLDRVLYHR